MAEAVHPLAAGGPDQQPLDQAAAAAAGRVPRPRNYAHNSFIGVVRSSFKTITQ